MKTFATTVFSLMAALMPAGASAAASDDVTVSHLGTNQTLLRVNTPGHYLLLPVQEANDEARINVLVGGKPDKSINVRLAKTKVDYYVPFDLTPYHDNLQDLVLSVVTHQDRSSVREAKEDTCWKLIEVADTFNTENREKYRPAYHHTPVWGWMNDPNGMFYKDGTWHLYFQHNPYGSKWQNLSWGHSTSTDLIHWTPQPEAIEPNGLGMVFSGSSVLDPGNTAGFGSDAVVSLYTSADLYQSQSLAWSNDGGKTFNIYGANPVISLATEARDPNMFRHAPSQQWVLALAHALEHEMLFFTSPDLKTWTLQSSFGKGIGAQDGVWECPDLFELPVQGSDEKKWVLICNLNPGGIFGGSATQYFIGDFDGKTFTADTDADGSIPTRWMDYGKDHYATVSFSDTDPSRRTVIGWMSNWQYAAEVPTMQYRSANTLPRDLSLFRGADGKLYLASAPSPELLALRGKVTAKSGSFAASERPRAFALPAENDGICEIVLDIDPAAASTVDLTLSNSKGEKVVMTYDVAASTMSFDRTKAGLSDFSSDFAAVTTAPTFNNGGKISLRLFVDRSSIELFGNDGRFVMTNLVFPTEPYTSLFVSANGGKAQISNLKIYSIAL